MVDLSRLTKENKIFLIIFLFVLGLAIADILGIALWTEPSGTYSFFFWTNATLVLIAFGFIYWLLTGDKSEAIAITLGGKIATLFGGEDLLFYLIKDRTFDGGNMIHLFSHPVIGKIAQAMNLSTVTPVSLLISVGIGVTIIYFLTYYLVRRL